MARTKPVSEPRARSKAEIREVIRKLRHELDIHRLPSPERLQLLEKLVVEQDELILYMVRAAAQA